MKLRKIYTVTGNNMKLDNVTLIAIEGVQPELALKALIISKRHIQFGKVKLLTTRKPIGLPHDIEYYNIPPMHWMGYNKFMITELNKYVDTEFCLVVQPDGFIINPNNWKNEFLDYDYIGAPWIYDSHQIKHSKWVFDNIKEKYSKMNVEDINVVGNGGFSLRSKKLLELCANSPFECTGPEDAYICTNYQEYFTQNGIKFAPEDLAIDFSYEPIERMGMNVTFGFHGNKELINKY